MNWGIDDQGSIDIHTYNFANIYTRERERERAESQSALPTSQFDILLTDHAQARRLNEAFRGQTGSIRFCQDALSRRAWRRGPTWRGMEGEFSLEGVTVSGPIPSHSSNGVKSLLSLVNSFQWRVHDALDQIGSTGT